MVWMWKKAVCGVLILMAGTAGTLAEEAADPPEDLKLLTLNTASIRSLLHLGPWGTDIRLKVQRPAFGSLSILQDEWFIQGVELRLPMKGMWVGVEKDLGEDVRRATVSLKRSF